MKKKYLGIIFTISFLQEDVLRQSKEINKDLNIGEWDNQTDD